MTASRFRVPHTLVLLAGMIVAALVLTWILPHGSYERTEDDGGHERVVSGTYDELEDPETLGPHDALLAVPKGFAHAADIIFFVFIIGGAFGVMRATGATDALIGFLLARLSNRPGWLVAGGMAVFAIGSSTIGMAEEYLPFVPILIALAIGLGFDTVTAVGIICVGYGVGYGVAAVNPFTVVIAQNISGLDELSGWPLRAALTVPFLALGFVHVWRYARKVKRDPSKSLVAGLDSAPQFRAEAAPTLNARHLVILSSTAAALAILVYGIGSQGWYLTEMGGAFLLLSVIYALVGRLGADGGAKAFCTGATELTTTALLIGFANAIRVVLEDGQVIDTVVHGLAVPLAELGPAASAVAMFAVQSLCNLFIPSGSGQAYVTMPVIAPLADLVGLSRQTAVLAYQFGDGFTNILVPTNAVLVGILAMARVPYDRWLRFIFPFMLQVWALGSIVLVAAALAGYS